MQDAGLAQAREIQLSTLTRIVGGQSFVAIAPSLSGKTTAYILGVLMRLKYSNDEAPKVLILVKDQERGQVVIDTFKLLAGNRGLRIAGLFGSGGMEEEISELMEGVDVVVATPARARAIYLKLGLNMNRLQSFIIDDADELIVAGQQLPINELARSAGKCQYLVFTSVLTRKLTEQISSFLEDPVVIEVSEISDNTIDIQDVQMFEVPNFQTKLNLLNYFLSQPELFEKVVIFANSKITARNIYKEIQHLSPVIYQPIDSSQDGIEEMEMFFEEESLRILIVAHESQPPYDLSLISSMIHVEIPESQQLMLSFIENDGVKRFVQLYVADAEMSTIKKLEHAIGSAISYQELPESLRAAKSKPKKAQQVEESNDTAFHKKKEANAKTFNYGIGDKLKMNKKRKYG